MLSSASNQISSATSNGKNKGVELERNIGVESTEVVGEQTKVSLYADEVRNVEARGVENGQWNMLMGKERYGISFMGLGEVMKINQSEPMHFKGGNIAVQIVESEYYTGLEANKSSV